MKAKNVLIVFAIVAMAVMFSGCAGAVGPDRIPKPISVQVKYERVLPIPNPSGPDRASLDWVYGSFEGGDCEMQKIAENIFTASALIKTETVITMLVYDPKKYNGSSLELRKRLFIDGKELIFEGSEYGRVSFILRNDETIEVTYPK